MAVKELGAAPSLPRLYATSVLPGMLPGLPGRSAPSGLPDLEITLADFSVDASELAVYDRVCGLRFSDTLPVTYLHILAFPLSVQLMTDSSFPYPLIGLVHLAQRMTQYRPVSAEDKLSFRVRTDRLRPHAKGVQFDVLAEARVGGELVWTGESTYLRRGTSGAGDDGGPAGSLPGDTVEADVVDGDAPLPAGGSSALWSVPTDIGRQYGRVSGDVNPIHLHPWAAKAFGFPRHIAHGLWTEARVLGALEGQLPDSFVVDVRFFKPLLLPSTVQFTSWTDAHGRAFAVRGTKKPVAHLGGTLRAR